MTEFSPEKIMPKSEKNSSRKEAFLKLAKIKKERGTETAMDEFFQKCKITPDFVQEKNKEKLSQMRDKLKKEAGVIIANHPGIIDIFFILKALGNRKDTFIFAAEKASKMYSDIFDPDMIISSADDYRNKLPEIIANGGVVIFYPTGGKERTSREIKFKRGFKEIFIDKIDPSCMVYSFHINPENIEDLVGITTPENIDVPNEKRKALFEKFYQAENDLSIQELQTNEETHSVRVNENYSKVEDWKDDPTKHYLETFGLDKNIDA